MSPALSFEAVSKTYRGGERPALDALSCHFPTGSISGFLGPNGAGKTTAFSVVSGFLRADSGTVRILGEEGFDPSRLEGRLGVLPQDAELPDRHTPVELLEHLSRLQGMGAVAADAEAHRLVELVRLGDRADSRIYTLSHGMRRRVAVASALIGSPELVLLDEPTSGLDPVQAHSLRQALASLRGRLSLVISSHNLPEVEQLCDHVVMLDHGVCTRQGSMADVTGRRSSVRWQLGPGEVPIEALRSALPNHEFTVGDCVLEQLVPAEGDVDSSSVVVARHLAAAGVPIRGVRRGESLEKSFRRFTPARS